MKTKKSAALSQPEKLVRRSAADIRAYARSAEARATSARLRAAGPDPTPEDLAEIPELTEEELNALRPAKQQLTVRLDADVLAWLKGSGARYQTRLNNLLRAVMVRDQARRAKEAR